MAAREEDVLSLCFSSSLKLFNLSERRRDISKLHPKVGHSCEKQWGCQGPQGRPVCRTSSPISRGETATFPILSSQEKP